MQHLQPEPGNDGKQCQNILIKTKNSQLTIDKYLKYLITRQQSTVLSSGSVVIDLMNNDGTLETFNK